MKTPKPTKRDQKTERLKRDLALAQYLSDVLLKNFVKDDEALWKFTDAVGGVRIKKVRRALKSIYHGRSKFGSWVRKPFETIIITRKLEKKMKERDKPKLDLHKLSSSLSRAQTTILKNTVRKSGNILLAGSTQTRKATAP